VAEVDPKAHGVGIDDGERRYPGQEAQVFKRSVTTNRDFRLRPETMYEHGSPPFDEGLDYDRTMRFFVDMAEKISPNTKMPSKQESICAH
jgi:hypothetical protein